MKLHSTRSGNAWGRQTTFPSESYKSARAAHGIWRASVKDTGKNGQPKKAVIVNLAPKQDLSIRFMPGFAALYNHTLKGH